MSFILWPSFSPFSAIYNTVCPNIVTVPKVGKQSASSYWHIFIRFFPCQQNPNNLIPVPILCKHILPDVFSTLPFKFSIWDYLGEHSIDRTQPKGWCVPITLKMQRAHHLLGGIPVSCWWAEWPYAREIRRRRPRGSSVTILCAVNQLMSTLINW